VIEFDWDDENLNHIARHGVTREETEFVLKHRTLEGEVQDWHDELRFTEVGMTAAGRVLLVVTTVRNDRIRVVTAYDANFRNRREFSEMK